MSHYVVRAVPLGPGQDVPVLVRDGVQVYSTSWWLIDQLLPGIRGSASNTRSAKMRAVAHYLQWAENYGFDWAEVVQSGTFMGAQVVKRIFQWMEVEVDLLGSESVKRLRVAPQTAAARTGFLFQYLDWYAGRLIEAMPLSGHKRNVQAAYSDWVSIWKTLFETMFTRSSPRKTPEPMDNSKRELFLRVIKPGYSGNPWQVGMQIRNYALLMLIYEHGLRISDVLQLHMDDICIGKGIFTIAERTSDPLETRGRRPNAKRRGNTVRALKFTPVSLEAMTLWLSERAQREKWPGATKCAFVFLSHWTKTSKPMAIRRPGQLFADLCRAYPERKSKDGRILIVGFNENYFHPHALRHDRAVRFVLDYDARYGWDLRGEEAMRKLFGWSKDSRQPAYYAQAAHLAIGVKAMLELSENRTKLGLAMQKGDEG